MLSQLPPVLPLQFHIPRNAHSQTRWSLIFLLIYDHVKLLVPKVVCFKNLKRNVVPPYAALSQPARQAPLH